MGNLTVISGNHAAIMITTTILVYSQKEFEETACGLSCLLCKKDKPKP